MTSFLQLAAILAIIIFTAKAAGYLSTRIGQPSVFGELLAGLVLGPSLIDLVHLPFITNIHLGETVHELGEIGVLLLMFLAGMELHLADLAKNTRVSAVSGIAGVFMPVVLGYAAGAAFGLDTPHALFLGLTLGATSVSISAQTLMELKVLRSRVGLGLLGAAVFDDVIVILLLSIFSAVFDASSAGGAQVLWIVLRMVAFLAASIIIGLYALPLLVRRTARLSISQGSTAFALITLLLYGIAAELVGGMAAITGAFIAGLMFNRTPEKTRIEGSLNALAYSFFVPIFFVDIGLRVNVRDMQVSALLFILVIFIVAVLGKVIGAGLGAKSGGFTWWESLQLGIGMVSRGEVGLIVASVGLGMGLLDNAAFSAIVGMVMLTTLVTPPFLRFSFARAPKPNEPSNGNEPLQESEAA
jgi:Kef-type K+ transport system membrane component KefB